MSLHRIPEGYASADGRYLIEPVRMGDSPRNQGHREWRVTPDPIGLRARRIFRTLADVRDAIGS